MTDIKKIFAVLFAVLCVTFNSCAFAKEKIEYSNPQFGIHVFKINTKKYGAKIKPYIAPKVVKPEKLYNDNCYELVVNGGFFDVKTGKSVSYVTIDNKTVADIEQNTKLVSDLKKQDRLEKVLSRGELRILENKRGKLKFDIDYHTNPVKKRGYHIKHALQAGPVLYPEMNLAGEGFVVYENDEIKLQSADILKRRPRTAIGLKGKYLYIVLFTNEHKVDANEMRDYMVCELKLEKILALDGGLSTAINYKNISIGSLGKYQRKVKSFLVIEK